MRTNENIEAIRAVVAELERLGVAHHIGGSLASSVHGLPRSTMDVDLVADLRAEHVSAFAAALESAYYVSRPMIADAVARRSCFNLIHFATMLKVDVFVVKNREYDRMAVSRARKVRLDPEDLSTELFVASPEDIVLAKLEWFRLGDEQSERQWGDVIGVLKVQQNHLDRPYLERWAAELGVADLLARAWKQAEEY